MRELSAFVLAGGQSTRMGRDKAFVEWGSTTLLGRALALASDLTAKVTIVGSKEKFAPFGRVVEDQFSNRGPLGGIHAALRASESEWNLVLAVDMPFLEPQFLQHLVQVARVESALVTVPRAGENWQPLCAVYRRAFLDVAEEALQQGKNKIDPLFARVRVQVVDEAELANAGFSPQMFRNLNTPEELQMGRV